jgi:hypothetical protein
LLHGLQCDQFAADPFSVGTCALESGFRRVLLLTQRLYALGRRRLQAGNFLTASAGARFKFRQFRQLRV